MALKRTTPKFCDPYIAGLAPLVGFVAGIVLCNIGIKNESYVLDQSSWACVKFTNGECSRYEKHPELIKNRGQE